MIVVGVGGVGSAAVHRVAARGASVLGLERDDVPHDRRSSHGAAANVHPIPIGDPAVAPIVRSALSGWRELGAKRGERLLAGTGSLDAAPSGAETLERAVAFADEHDLPYRTMDPRDVADRFPGLQLPEGFTALFQPEGGFVRSEQAIVAQVEEAHRHGGEVHGRERVIDWSPSPDGVRVSTDRDDYTASSVILCTGPWLGQLVDGLADVVVTERHVVGRFQPLALERFRPDRLPAFSISVDDDRYYGTPVADLPGIGFGRAHHRTGVEDPDVGVAGPTVSDESMLRRGIERFLPKAAGPTMALEPSLHATTPDGRIVIDRLGPAGSVVVAGPLGAHGFGLAPAIAEAATDLALEGETSLPIGPFSLARFDLDVDIDGGDLA